MKKVGITGATGRLATILIRQLKDEYQLKLFSFEKPECTPRARIPHPAPPTNANTKVATLSSPPTGTDAETLQTEKETYDTTVIDLSDRDQVKGRHHPEPLLPLLCLHSPLCWPGLFEGLDVVIHLAAYSLAVPFPEQGESQLHNRGMRARLVFNMG